MLQGGRISIEMQQQDRFGFKNLHASVMHARRNKRTAGHGVFCAVRIVSNTQCAVK
jgi:hypothetical protein